MKTQEKFYYAAIGIGFTGREEDVAIFNFKTGKLDFIEWFDLTEDHFTTSCPKNQKPFDYGIDMTKKLGKKQVTGFKKAVLRKVERFI